MSAPLSHDFSYSMTNKHETQRQVREICVSKGSVVVAGFFSLGALAITFFTATSSVDPAVKTGVFCGALAIFVLVYVIVLVKPFRSAAQEAETAESKEGIDNNLASLDEVHQVFSGSLSTEDSFRLVAGRIREMLPLRSLSLLLWDETRTRFEVRARDGLVESISESHLNRCAASRSVEFSGKNVAVPLFKENEVFGVLFLSSDEPTYGSSHSTWLAALGERAARLIVGGLAYDRIRENALTDATTELPNERAFFLVLENQVAGSQRNRSRFLTVLSMDIKNFDEINVRFGHATGDRILSFTSGMLRDTLRQMDFLARSRDDEFLAVLPTASREVSHDVIARINTDLFGRRFRVDDNESIEVVMNIGWATFGDDGETPSALLAAARIRKDQVKSSTPDKVLWFPTEIVNQ